MGVSGKPKQERRLGTGPVPPAQPGDWPSTFFVFHFSSAQCADAALAFDLSLAASVLTEVSEKLSPLANEPCKGTRISAYVDKFAPTVRRLGSEIANEIWDAGHSVWSR